MKWLKAGWMRFWFTAAEPTNLAVCRILIYAVLLIRYLILPLKVGAFSQMSMAFWKPIPLLGHFMFPVLDGTWLKIFEVTWLISLGLCSVGLFTRLNTAVAFLLGFYLLWIPHNFGKLHHTDMITILVLGTMMLARCGDALSVDALLLKRRQGFSEIKRPVSGEYTWPIRTVWLIMATIFFAAGVAKLRHSGLAWVFSDNMAVKLIKMNFMAYIDYPPLLNWGLYLGRYVWLCQILAGVTLLAELTYPLVLFSRRARRLLAPAMFFIFLGSTLIFLPSFIELLACNVFYVPWDRVGVWLKSRRFFSGTVSIRGEASSS